MIAEIDKLEKRGPVTPKGPRTPGLEVVSIGAGPYGLSSSTYLKARGLDIRVFGQPMAFWVDRMPEGMLLGAPAAGNFPPLLNFVAGTDFASRELTASIGRSRVRI